MGAGASVEEDRTFAALDLRDVEQLASFAASRAELARFATALRASAVDGAALLRLETREQFEALVGEALTAAEFDAVLALLATGRAMRPGEEEDDDSDGDGLVDDAMLAGRAAGVRSVR